MCIFSSSVAFAIAGFPFLAAQSTAVPSAAPIAAPVAAAPAMPVAAAPAEPIAAAVAALIAAPLAACRQDSNTLTIDRPSSDHRPAKPAWGPDYSAKPSSSVYKSFPSRRRIMLRPHRHILRKTIPWQHNPLQASHGTPLSAAAGDNPLLPMTSQQRVQPTIWHAQQYAFRDPRMENVTKTLQAVGATQAAAYMFKLRAQERGTVATPEDVPPGSSMEPNPVSIAVGPAEGSVGVTVGPSSFGSIAAGSAVSSGEGMAQQVTPRLNHQDDAMSGQEHMARKAEAL